MFKTKATINHKSAYKKKISTIKTNIRALQKVDSLTKLWQTKLFKLKNVLLKFLILKYL